MDAATLINAPMRKGAYVHISKMGEQASVLAKVAIGIFLTVYATDETIITTTRRPEHSSIIHVNSSHAHFVPPCTLIHCKTEVVRDHGTIGNGHDTSLRAGFCRKSYAYARRVPAEVGIGTCPGSDFEPRNIGSCAVRARDAPMVCHQIRRVVRIPPKNQPPLFHIDVFELVSTITSYRVGARTILVQFCASVN